MPDVHESAPAGKDADASISATARLALRQLVDAARVVRDVWSVDLEGPAYLSALPVFSSLVRELSRWLAEVESRPAAPLTEPRPLDLTDPAAVEAWLTDLRAQIDDVMAAGEDATRSPAHRALGRVTARSHIVDAGPALEQLLWAADRDPRRRRVTVPPPAPRAPVGARGAPAGSHRRRAAPHVVDLGRNLQRHPNGGARWEVAPPGPRVLGVSTRSVFITSFGMCRVNAARGPGLWKGRPSNLCQPDGPGRLRSTSGARLPRLPAGAALAVLAILAAIFWQYVARVRPDEGGDGHMGERQIRCGGTTPAHGTWLGRRMGGWQ